MRVSCIDPMSENFPCTFECLGRFVAETMSRPMDVRVIGLVIGVQRVEHDCGLLRCCGVVEIDHVATLDQWKVCTHRVHIKSHGFGPRFQGRLARRHERRPH